MPDTLAEAANMFHEGCSSGNSAMTDEALNKMQTILERESHETQTPVLETTK
jgi:hypothetical protein